MKRLLIPGLLCLAVPFISSLAPTKLEQVIGKLSTFVNSYPQEKVYLHFDKPIYASGEDMWFSTYLVNASTHQTTNTSKVIYVELFNSSKKMIAQRVLYSPDGTSHGDIHLPDSLPEDTYLVRAYTHNMKALPQDFFFSKRIPILSQHRFRKTQYEKYTPDIQFFPEGGTFLADVENRVAFKAINQKGIGILVEGEIHDSAGKVVATFETEHAGMGSFTMTPQAGEVYEAVVNSMASKFPLPKPETKGYLMRVIPADVNLKVIVYSNLKEGASRSVILIAQTRGIVGFAARAELKGPSMVVNIPRSAIESGISQITLFDANGIPQCERLVFINHHDALQFSVQTDKQSYKDREMVELDIVAKNNHGTPVAGNFSVSIYDENKIHDPESYPTSIVENLLLTSDLTGRIDDPGYYLNDTLPEVSKHVDLLMMTHGWRRFTWKEIQADQLPDQKYLPEQGLVMRGKITNLSGKKTQKNISLKILTSNGEILIMQTDSLGAFYSSPMNYFDSVSLRIQTDDNKSYPGQYRVHMDPVGNSLPLKSGPLPFSYFNADEFLSQTQERITVTKGFAPSADAVMLRPVEIKSKGPTAEDYQPARFYQTPDHTFDMSKYKGGYFNILQALAGKFAGVTVVGYGGSENLVIRGQGSPLFLLNGFPVDVGAIRTVSTFDVAKVDILTTPGNTVIYGQRAANGIVAVYTKTGRTPSEISENGMVSMKYPGFYRAREFYSPRYDKPQEQNIYDIRNTLYWNPSVRTDSLGRAHLSFYTSDLKSTYKIQVEGISSDGVPGAGMGKLIAH